MGAMNTTISRVDLGNSPSTPDPARETKVLTVVLETRSNIVTQHLRANWSLDKEVPHDNGTATLTFSRQRPKKRTVSQPKSPNQRAQEGIQ